MSGVRGDSIFFVYFFLTSATIAASLVLGISLLEWTVVILALTVVLSAEMFNQSVKALFAVRGRPVDDAARTALRIGFRRRLCRHRRVDFDHRLDLGQSRYRDVSGKLTREAQPCRRKREGLPSTDAESGLTLLAALRKWLPGTSWSAARKLLAGRHVLVNDALCLDEARRMTSGEAVTLYQAAVASPPSARDVRLVWLDSEVIVVDKPAGMTTLRHAAERSWTREENSANPRWMICFRILPPGTKSRRRAVTGPPPASFGPPHRPRHERPRRFCQKHRRAAGLDPAIQGPHDRTHVSGRRARTRRRRQN